MINKTLGHYRVVQELGRGGMGEVYLADDLNLNRKVALKFLPDAFTGNPERMARFEREAKLLASLNHPNIAAIYGLEQAEGKRFIVMELVDGETLAQRLSKGALPIEEALGICRQIAEGLEAAHEKGIIHRDLKPANVMITEGDKVKILDFGLAKALAGETQSAAASQSPTITEAMTQPGVILGTAAYMSPEQAKGKAVDKRADIWAFGCILYECLTGKPSFDGDTITETLAEVLTREPKWEAVPEKLKPLLRHCLEKDPKRRLRDITEMWAWIDYAPGPIPAAEGRKAAWFWPLLALLLVIGTGTLAYISYYSKADEKPVQRFSVLLPNQTIFDTSAGLSISPDGLNLAFIAMNQKGKAILYFRPLSSLEAQPLGEADAYDAFWSPDGRWIAFSSHGKLRKVEVGEKRIEDLCDISSLLGGSWNADGTIIFASGFKGPLFRVPDSGGKPEQVTALDEKMHETGHAWPCFLPDGRHFLYLASTGHIENWVSKVGSLDSRESQTLFKTHNKVTYVSPGYLLFVSGTTLMARPFRARSLELFDEAKPIADGIGTFYFFGGASYSVSQSGILACQIISGAPFKMQWYDRQGKVLETIGPPGYYTNPSISPDGKRIAVDRYESWNAPPDVWVFDLDRQGDPTRFTFNPGDDSNSLWSPDGRFLVFSSWQESAPDLYLKTFPETGKEEILYKSPDDKYATSWFPDGKTLMFESRSNSDKPYGIWLLPIIGDHKPIRYSRSEFNQWGGQFSPDGRWVAYASDESGQNEIYVEPYPQQRGGKWKVSVDGGLQPKWRIDGKEIYYLALDGNIMGASIRSESNFTAGVPVRYFDSRTVGLRTRNNYDVTRDGQRFLLFSPTQAGESFTITLNWPSLLKR